MATNPINRHIFFFFLFLISCYNKKNEPTLTNSPLHKGKRVNNIEKTVIDDYYGKWKLKKIRLAWVNIDSVVNNNDYLIINNKNIIYYKNKHIEFNKKTKNNKE